MYLDNWYVYMTNTLRLSYTGHTIVLINTSGTANSINDRTVSFSSSSLVLGSGNKPVSRHDYCLEQPISNTIVQIKQNIGWGKPTYDNYEHYFYYSAVIKNISQEDIKIREAGFKYSSYLFCRWVFDDDIIITPNEEIILPVLSGYQPINQNLNRNFRSFLSSQPANISSSSINPINVSGNKVSHRAVWAQNLCIKVGNSDMPFNENQYHLQGYLDCAYLEPRTINSNCDALKYQETNSYCFQVSQLIQNSFSEPITIKEIGLYDGINLSSSETYMLAREVLDEPIILQPGQIISLSMTLAPWED